jgi:hypothetical protein
VEHLTLYDYLVESTQTATISSTAEPPYSTAKSAKDTKNLSFALFASFALFSFGCGFAAPGKSFVRKNEPEEQTG